MSATAYTIPEDADIISFPKYGMEIHDCNTYEGSEIPPPSVDTPLSHIEQTRGIVCEGSKIICKSFPNTREYDGIPEGLTDTNIYDFDWTKALEVTLLMVFNHENKWFLRTTKHLDAFESYWLEEKSFGEIFVETLENYGCTFEGLCAQLDKERVYSFSLPFTGMNCMVSKNNDQHIYYCGSFLKNGEDYKPQYENVLPFETLPLLSFNGIQELENSLKEAEVVTKFSSPEGDREFTEYRFQGFIGIEKPKAGVPFFVPRVIKIYNKRYKEKLDAKNIENKLLYEYLKVRCDENGVEDFVQRYKDSPIIETTEAYEQNISEICKTIHEIYMDKFFKKKKDLPKYHPVAWKVLQNLHAWYIQEKNKCEGGRVVVSLREVSESVDCLSANDLRRLICSFMTNRLELQNRAHRRNGEVQEKKE
jgi:hypothetical protein